MPTPDWHKVSFLLGNGEGTDGVAPSVDVSRYGHSISTTGTTFQYDSSTAPAGTISGMPVKTVDSYSYAADAPGANYEGVPHGRIWEFECRFYCDDATWPASTNSYIAGNRHPSGGGSYWNIFYYGPGGYLAFYAQATFVCNLGTPSTKSWNHVVVGFDGTKFYGFLNGTPATSYASSQIYWVNHMGIGSYAGGPHTTYGFNGWLEMMRFSNQTVYTPEVSFTPPTAVLPEGTYTEPTYDEHWADVVLLLANGEGSDGSTTFTDQSDASTTVNVSGSPEYDTGVTNIAAASILNPVADDAVYIAHGLSANESFTAECWYYVPTETGVQYIMAMRSASGGHEAAIYLNASTFTVWANGTTRWTSSGDTTGGQWYHIRFEYDATAGAFYFYLNGTARIAWAATPGTYDPEIWFGSYYDTATYDYGIANGNLELIRVTAGVARSADYPQRAPSSVLPTAYTLSVDALTQEDGFALLQEDETYILLESAGAGGGTIFPWGMQSLDNQFAPVRAAGLNGVIR